MKIKNEANVPDVDNKDLHNTANRDYFYGTFFENFFLLNNQNIIIDPNTVNLGDIAALPVLIHNENKISNHNIYI